MKKFILALVNIPMAGLGGDLMAERKGLFRNPKGTDFKTDEEIRQKLALEGDLDGITFRNPKGTTKDVYHYLDKAKERSLQMKELSPRQEGVIKARVPRTSIISVLGDLHFGHPSTHNDRIKQEIEVIKNTPDSYVILGGDVVDGIHWGGASQAEQSANLDEQHGFARSLFKTLKGRVLAGLSAEHDSKWATKTGPDPYSEFTELTGAPYVRGVAEIDLDVGEQNYKIVAQHKGRGHSMYNKNHPTHRQSRFHLQGADVYINAHTHQKQVSQEAVREFGKARKVTHIATGPYKPSDVYGEREGYINQKPEEMYGVSFRVNADRKKVEVEEDIIEAHKKWNPFKK
jgi:hypothetical protein